MIHGEVLGYLLPFLIHWGITALSLWLASLVFKGISFAGASSLILAALLLGFANAVIRPILVLLTLPLTLLTLGAFMLVINALMLVLVSTVVSGFRVSGFWTAFFSSIFISLLSLALGALVPEPGMTIERLPTSGHTFLI